MESFQFIPNNQKNIDQLIQKKSSSLDEKVINWLVFLLVVYTIIVVAVYWIMIINEKDKLKQSISILDTENSSYYPKGDIEQTLFNLNDLTNKSYNPIPVIKSIESSYITNSKVKNFIYNKADKSINFSMMVPSVSDVTIQVQKFKNIKEIASVDFDNTITSTSSPEASFNVRIKLN